MPDIQIDTNYLCKGYTITHPKTTKW